MRSRGCSRTLTVRRGRPAGGLISGRIGGMSCCVSETRWCRGGNRMVSAKTPAVPLTRHQEKPRVKLASSSERGENQGVGRRAGGPVVFPDLPLFPVVFRTRRGTFLQSRPAPGRHSRPSARGKPSPGRRGFPLARAGSRDGGGEVQGETCGALVAVREVRRAGRRRALAISSPDHRMIGEDGPCERGPQGRARRRPGPPGRHDRERNRPQIADCGR